MKEETNYIENEKKKRVYKNSLLLFVRIFIITIINLYSVRLVVNGLGVIDYGIFNAVVGVVMTLSCVFPVIAVSVQRFFSSEMVSFCPCQGLFALCGDTKIHSSKSGLYLLCGWSVNTNFSIMIRRKNVFLPKQKLDKE